GSARASPGTPAGGLQRPPAAGGHGRASGRARRAGDGDGLGGRLRPCACELARPRKGGDRVNACAEAARILIADDDDDARRLLVKYLTEKGFHVTTAEDGSEACRRVFADEPDLVLDRKCDE